MHQNKQSNLMIHDTTASTRVTNMKIEELNDCLVLHSWRKWRVVQIQRIINSKLKEILVNQTIPKSKKSNRAKESISELMLKMQSIKTLTIPLFSHTFSITKQSQKITIHKPKITNTEIIECTCLNKNNYNIFLAIFLPSKWMPRSKSSNKPIHT